MITALDLFSGYGGISYGLRDYIKPIVYCEIEPYARAILASRISEGELPFAPIIPDVRSIRGKLGGADIIVGGFPCQDISVAGPGAGLKGKRSGLFFEIIRLTKEIKPTFVFLENVPAIRTRGLREVVRAFTDVGYDCRWTCVSAASVGATHKRERWFLLAYTSRKRISERRQARQNQALQTDTNGNGEKEFMAHANGSRELQSKRHEQTFRGRVSDCNQEVPNTQSIGLEAQSDGYRGVKTNIAEPWAGGARDESWWSTEPNVGRVVNGLAHRVDRVKALGNGVVPLQVKTAFEKLIGITSAPSGDEEMG